MVVHDVSVSTTFEDLQIVVKPLLLKVKSESILMDHESITQSFMSAEVCNYVEFPTIKIIKLKKINK